MLMIPDPSSLCEGAGPQTNQWSPLNNLMHFNLPNPSLPTILKREESGQARLENTDMYTYMQVGMGQTYTTLL